MAKKKSKKKKDNGIADPKKVTVKNGRKPNRVEPNSWRVKTKRVCRRSTGVKKCSCKAGRKKRRVRVRAGRYCKR